ncbi:hypothetical protein GOP47_0029363 [Adiantum capillus-veneris]|nr:hypothetical protein GOP47_0029363 [Adiantum capillus-veneris]
MALQWVMLGAAATAEALLALLLTVPYPPPLRRRLVALIASLLQPALGIVPFAAFQLLDIYWKNEHRLNCSSDVCTLPERDRYERSLFKAQRNTLLAIGSCFLYWLLYRMCKYHQELQKLDDDVKSVITLASVWRDGRRWRHISFKGWETKTKLLQLEGEDKVTAAFGAYTPSSTEYDMIATSAHGSTSSCIFNFTTTRQPLSSSSSSDDPR